MIPTPIAFGMTLCEKVIIEEGSRRLTLVNCFTLIEVEGFPSAPQSFLVLAALTNGAGDATIEVDIERSDTMETIYAVNRRVHFPDRFKEVQVLFRIEGCVFPVPGRYHLYLHVDKEPITQRRLRVVASEA